MTVTQVNDDPTVLLVDDERDSIALLSTLLSGSGFTVLSAESLKEARDISRRERLDLCVVDICLQSGEFDTSGLIVAKDLRDSYPLLPIIGYSSVYDSELFGAVGNAVFSASLPKSAMNSRTLLRVIENWRELAIAYRHSRDTGSTSLVKDKASKFRAFVGAKTAPTLTPSAGLFIGIDEYEQHDPLKGAFDDARSMFDYFSASRPEGAWRRIYRNRDEKCDRADVFIALHELVEQVSEGNTGLFYFAGHGCSVGSGLILLSSDAHRRHVHDTGVPFERILSILSSQCRQNTRFLVILDCCRSGPPPSAVPSTPNNVSVLYACPRGEKAVEIRSGGILTQAIFAALDSRVEREDDTIETRTLRSVFSSIPAIMAAASTTVDTPELIGGLSDEIHLPIMRTTKQREVVTGTPPESTIITFPIANNIHEMLEIIGGAYLDCLGLTVFDRSYFNYVLEEHVVIHNEHVRVQLPQNEGIQNLPCALMQRFPGRFSELQLEWSTQIHFATIRHLAEQLELECDPLDDGCIITWQQNQNLRGLVRLESLGDDHTVMRVRCLNREGDGLGLESLCPKLDNIYNRFRWALPGF